MEGPLFSETDSEVRREQWDGFIDRVAPYRADLFALGLRLTGSPFDAEDLVHDALIRAFGASQFHFGRVQNPKAYLCRVLSNLWIDSLRRQKLEHIATETDMETFEQVNEAEQAALVRDAAYTLFDVLPARERACIVLADICGFSHLEIADILTTSAGAVKSAVHRARKKLRTTSEEPERSFAPRVSRSLVEQFVTALKANDLDGLKSIMADSLEADVFPSGVGVGFQENADDGWLSGCLYHHIQWREEQGVPFPNNYEIREVDGDPVVLVIRNYGDGRGAALEEVWRFEEEDGLIARARDYGFSPDLVEHVAASFNLPFRPVAYRFREGLYSDPISN